ncbi:hypothetical protein [uncultured Dokdonia sp.]|uniref:hypothetical protein n=1 Tax=uncultured Dokdonia sp. TaxID=575653 RepID=UPI0026074487|nr:hypothetical protein [uncultured Dokdonia sp.]
MSTYTVLWKNEVIGQLTSATLDMWYLEGTWVPNTTQLSKNFTTLVSSFDAMSVITDPTMGIRALLEDQNSNQTPIVVISLEEKWKLSVRLVINEPAIEWLIQNVPEDKEY